MTLRMIRVCEEAALVRNISPSTQPLQLDRIAVAHKIYGIPQTINTGNYVYFLAYKELSSLRCQAERGLTPDKDLDGIVTSKSH